MGPESRYIFRPMALNDHDSHSHAPGSPLPPAEVRARILAALPGAHVEITDLTGTSDHYEALVVAPQFVGRTRIEQHKLVYAALGALVGNEIHALALKTHTPEAWSASKG